MTIFSDSFRYCPFCAGELTDPGNFRFCPHCGKKIYAKDHKEKKKSKKIRKGQTVLAQFQPEQILPPEQALPNERERPVTALLPARPDEDYTVVLKFCPDKEALFAKLAGLLKRDKFAIRLAVELAPAVLMYKSKFAEVLPVMKECYAAGALLTVFCGDVTLKGNFPENLLVNLSSAQQDLIKTSPPALWLGETVYCAAGQIQWQGRPGVLVLSSHYLYFVYGNGRQTAYQLTPVDRIGSVERAESDKTVHLLIRRLDQPEADCYLATQHKQIAELQQLLATAVAACNSRR